MKDQYKFEKVSCNLCDSDEYSVVYRSEREKEKDVDLIKKFRASGDELLIDQLVQCSRCGLKYVNPRIKGSLIVSAYSEGDDPVFVSQADARERTFDKAVQYIEKFRSEKGKILDVGTAGGSFLAAAKKRGWQVKGCEPNKWLANWGNKKYGIPIETGTLFDCNYGDEQFDVVTLWDVIEHTPDPKKTLEETNRILKKGGLLVVNYPDIGSWLARLMGRKWLFLTSVHLYYFTPKTIKQILEKTGFDIVTVKPHFQELELGYLMFRAESYSKIISKIGLFFVNFLGLQYKRVPYWLGQTFVLARKNGL